jgi:linoleoyl-CoA desaturase
MTTTPPTFARQDKLKFFRTLNSRVNNYFKENNIKKTGNWKLHLKTIIDLFFCTLLLILTLDMPFWVHLLLTIVMGIGMAGVGMNVMHDGNHGSYSNKTGSINSWWYDLYSCRTCTTGRYNTMYYTTPTRIFRA